MLSSTQLLTVPTSFAHHKSEDITSSALSLVSSSLLFFQTENSQTKDEARMALPHSRSTSRDRNTELWFSRPNRARDDQGQVPNREETAYQETAYQAMSSRHRAQRSASPSQLPSIPLISTTTAVHKPLPPSPESEKRRRKPVSLRSLVRRRPSDQLDPAHLQPESHQRSSSANGNLSPDPYHYYYQQQSSRSMPTSPAEFSQASHQPSIMARAHSAATNYADSDYYMHYSQQTQQSPQRATSMNTFFEPQLPRTRRINSDAGTPSSATPSRQRPHTWLSPTEPNQPFEDASEFRLFVEATSGLPDGSLDFNGLSPSSPPHLQGSLFARGRQNDRIPIPLQNPAAVQPQSHSVSGWQSMGYDYMSSQSGDSPLLSSSALPRLSPQQRPQLSTNLNAINLELERLGLNNEAEPEDELPDYAQSQAEMNAKRRKEATARARELEARWNNSRSWRGR